MEQNPTKTDKLTKRQRLFIPVLLQSKSIAEACKAYGLDRSQFYQWRKQAAFRAAVEAAQAEIVADAMHGLRLNLSGAVETLTALLNSEQEAIKLRASLGLLDYHLRAAEVAELEKRLAALEALQQ